MIACVSRVLNRNRFHRILPTEHTEKHKNVRHMDGVNQFFIRIGLSSRGPQITQIHRDFFEPQRPRRTQRRKGAMGSQSETPRQGEVLAVKRPGSAGSGNRPEIGLSCRFPDPAACAKRKPRLLFSICLVGEDKGRNGVPRARRPVRRSSVTNAWIQSGRPSHRRQAIRSPVVLPTLFSRTLNPPTAAICGPRFVI